jgi:hypothetical protein
VEEHGEEDSKSEGIRPARRAACQDSLMHILQAPTVVRVIMGLMAKTGRFVHRTAVKERKEGRKWRTRSHGGSVPNLHLRMRMLDDLHDNLAFNPYRYQHMSSQTFQEAKNASWERLLDCNSNWKDPTLAWAGSSAHVCARQHHILCSNHRALFKQALRGWPVNITCSERCRRDGWRTAR